MLKAMIWEETSKGQHTISQGKARVGEGEDNREKQCPHQSLDPTDGDQAMTVTDGKQSS